MKEKVCMSGANYVRECMCVCVCAYACACVSECMYESV